jgi:hypothetical protein
MALSADVLTDADHGIVENCRTGFYRGVFTKELGDVVPGNLQCLTDSCRGIGELIADRSSLRK